MNIKTSKSEIKFTKNKSYKTAHLNLVEKEYNVIKILSNYKQFKKHLPKNVNLNQNTLSYTYIKGEIAGYYLTDFGYKEGLFTRQSFNNFINFHLNLSKIKDQKLIGIAHKYNYQQALAELTHYKKHNPEILTSTQWKKLFKKVANNKNIFDQQNLVLSQFDLYPENILITDDEFKIIDWESLAYLPSAFIPAFFNLLFWREKIWRDLSIKIFIDSYHSTLIFEKSFSIFTLILAVRFIYQIRAYSKINDTTNSAINWFYKNIDTYLGQDEIKVEDVRFLMQESFISALSNAHNLGNLQKYFVYEKSFSNVVTYFKTNKGEYILKLFNPTKTQVEFNNEISIINHLKTNELPVYNIIKTPELASIHTVRSFGYDRMYYVAEYISGVELDRHSFSVEHIKQMGNMLACIHNLNVVHGDFSKRNLIFNAEKLIGVLDFEYSKFIKNDNNEFYKDLAHSLVLLCISYSAQYIPYTERLQIFLKSYFETIQLSKKINKIDLQNLLIYFAIDEKEKYLKLNPKGDMSKYDLIVGFLTNFQLKNL